MKTLFFLYAMLARFGFEWALPVYSIFYLPTNVSLIIWALFLIWQIPVTLYLIADFVANAKKQADKE